MAWTAPKTFTAGNTLPAADLNTHLRDNLLETAAAKATTAGRIFVATGTNALAERAISRAVVATSQTTTSITYANLATTGPAVTLTTGTTALVAITTKMWNDIGTAQSFAAVDITGASTIAADDSVAINFQSDSANQKARMSVAYLVTGLTGGSNTFTLKYHVSAGTGTFVNREITVMAL